MIAGILFMVIYIFILFFIIFLLPIVITKNIFKFKLTKKDYFEYFIYLLFLPISILFSKWYYEHLEKQNVVNSKKKFIKIFWIMILFSFMSSLFIVKIAMKNYVLSPFQVNGQSMYPAVYDKNFILINKFSTDYNRWDIVVFNGFEPLKENNFLKRIIWIAWDTIKIEDWKVSIKVSEKFEKLDENYLDEESKDYTYVKWLWDKVIYEVPENSYFVLWDNRSRSTDSRQCFSYCTWTGSTEFISKENIVWKYFLDLWYYDLRKFEYTHPQLWIDTTPKFFDIK